MPQKSLLRFFALAAFSSLAILLCLSVWPGRALSAARTAWRPAPRRPGTVGVSAMALATLFVLALLLVMPSVALAKNCWMAGFCHESSTSAGSHAKFGPATEAECGETILPNGGNQSNPYADGRNYFNDHYWSGSGSSTWVNPWSHCTHDENGDPGTSFTLDCWASGFCYQSNQSENTTRPDAAFGPATQARCDAAGLQRAWGEGVDYASNRYWSAWQTQEWVNPWSICNENVCGDGVAVLGREACDDGDTDNGDGCSSTCTVESGWDCSSGTCVDINECAINADNCDTNATCSNTTGNFDCDCNAGYTGDGQTCETECGDGIPVGAEECDDGNTNDGDCCSSTCNFEAAGDSCDDQDGNGCTEGQCGGLGDCVAHPVSDGDPCTQDGAFCNGAESCQAGACAGAGDPCMGGGECADQCDEVNDTCNRPAGDPCTEDGEACTLDQCDGAGACAHPAGNGGELCRSEGGPICDPAEYCDGVNPTCPTDFVEPNTTECKAGAEDTCDPAEYCTGVAGEACPADEWADDGTSCDDGDATTSNDECVLGMCVCPGSPDDDVDDDGMPDLCDPDDGSIVVNQATAWPRRSKKARFIAKMSMTTDADTALDLSGGISVAFSDAASMLEQVDFAAEDCITKARGRKVQCRLADKTAKLLISQDKKDTSKYSMKLVVTKRGFESPVVGPIGVRVTAGDLDRTGQNANCTQRNAKTACR